MAQSLRLTTPRFAPGWGPSVVVALLLPLLITLGMWQLSRAAQKVELQDSYSARAQQAPISLLQLVDEQDPAHVRVKLQGYFDAAHSLLLDNRMRDGLVGVELLQPFFDQLSGRWVLLNRGWLSWLDRREAVAFTTPKQSLALVARVYVPLGEAFQLGQAEPTQHWPKLVTKADPLALWQQLERRGEVYELRLEPGPASYLAQWPVVAMSADKHYGYAVQWFALATALLGLYIYLGLHNARQLRGERNHERGHPQPSGD